MPRGRPRKVVEQVQPEQVVPVDVKPVEQTASEIVSTPVDTVAQVLSENIDAQKRDVDVITEQDFSLIIPENVRAEFDTDSNCVTFYGEKWSESINLTAPRHVIKNTIARVAGR